MTRLSDLDHKSAPPKSLAKRPTALKSKESLSAWERWEMGSFQTTGPAAPPPGSASQDLSANEEPTLKQLQPVLLIDEAELTRLRTEAVQAGQEEGLKLGYLEGQKQGYADAIALGESEASQLRVLTASLSSALRNVDKEIADDLITLALDIARQLVLRELATDPELILIAVRSLLQTEPALSGNPRLLLHPEDLTLVKQYLSDDLQTAGWLLRADPSLNRGGCRVHATSGEIDATLETRWHRITTALGRSEKNLNHSP
ncbi:MULTISPECIES: flagellar assembly protein FliH [unclassified Glaciimonas]|nr:MULTISPECIES: flagellar assembly protein FliH [unclassified Glaciimonas]MEB0010206.1 flagellar assembly protein FliH [Glaciimonas sp. Cout2]